MSKSIGTVGFRDREKWSPHTFFRKDDRILHGRSTLYAKEDHESGDEFDPSKWGYLTDGRGIDEAIATARLASEEATASAQEAAEKATEAQTQAEEARQAAALANAEAEAAQEATGIFTENVKLTDSDEFVYAIVDLNGTLLWGIRKDGTAYQPKGMPEETKKALSALSGYQIVDSPQYLLAIADSDDNMVFAIDRRGASHVNAIKGVCTVEQFDSKEFLFAVMDSAGNLLFGIDRAGAFQASKFMLHPDVQKQIAKAEASHTEEDDRDGEFIYKVTDKDGMIVFAVRWDGRSYMPKGIPEEQKVLNRKMDKRMNDLEKRLANFRGGAGDWSDSGSMRIPIPRLGIVNILSKTMPTAKAGLGTPGVNCQIPCQWEFWDQQGNYAKIWVKMSCQGNSSMGFIKKNLAIDMFKDSTMEDEYTIKFGDWVAQDSFHLKAYYTDAFRGVGVCSYMLYEEIMGTRGMRDNAPYKEGFADNYGVIADEYQDNHDLAENYDTGAKCFPMGFPVAVYQNGEFYGLYSWQIKKHRDNYHMNKKTAEHIHLDGTLTADSLWNGNIQWGYFEVRNPKSLYNSDGTKYDGDRPKEIMGADSEGYDKGDKDMKRCATAKQYIIDLSHRIAELNAAKAEGKTAEEIRVLIDKYFNVSFMLDYIIHAQIINNADGFNKNWQWTTWDGVRWTVNPYDLDMSFGGYFVGNITQSPPTGWVGNSMSSPVGWVIKYYLDDLKARYAYLRGLGLFDPEHVAGIVKGWTDRIGEDLFEQEYAKWNESPCCRDSQLNKEYWQRKSYSNTVAAWTGDTAYANNALCHDGGKVWQSRVANNTANKPDEDDGTNWVEVGYEPEREYTSGDICYHGAGVGQQFKFQCVKGCIGEPPFKGFYTNYPRELGYYDSPYRVLKWVEARVASVDKLMGYTPEADLSRASIITPSMIETIINQH